MRADDLLHAVRVEPPAAPSAAMPSGRPTQRKTVGQTTSRGFEVRPELHGAGEVLHAGRDEVDHRGVEQREAAEHQQRHAEQARGESHGALDDAAEAS